MIKPESIYSRHLVHPVCVLSVSDGKNENISTMAWVSAVSTEPPLISVAVSPKRYSHQLILNAQEFAILFLSNLQNELATLAGTISGQKKDKWALPQFQLLRKPPNKIKSPVLKDCRAVLECKLVQHVNSGDHSLFIGEIVHSEYDPDVQPLILFNRKYYNPGQFIAD